MINNDDIKSRILPEVNKKCRKLEYYLIENLILDKEIEIVNELHKFQNMDGGFGHGLEADVRMPESSVLATTFATDIIERLKNEELKNKIIKDIVPYFEETFNDKYKVWEFLSSEVENYPHAIWWNYDPNKEIPFGNPTPEIVGFLYQHKGLLKKIDINILIDRVVNYITKGSFIENADDHTLYSVIKFYNRMSEDIKKQIKDEIQLVVNKRIELGLGKWNEYVLQPYNIALLNKDFLLNYQKEYKKNLEYNQKLLDKGLVEPLWNWYQYEDVFQKIKHEWTGSITYDIIRLLKSEKQ